MARGNQRDKARVSHAAQKIFESEVHVEQEKNQKDQAAKKSKNTVSRFRIRIPINALCTAFRLLGSRD